MKLIAIKVKYMNTMKDKFNTNSIINKCMKSFKFFIVIILFSGILLLVSSCENYVKISYSHNVTFLQRTIISIDPILKNDTAYYHTYTFVCDADTICHYKYTCLLAPEQPIKAQFIPSDMFDKYRTYFSKFKASILDTNLNVLTEIVYPQEFVSVEVSTQNVVGQFYYSDMKLPQFVITRDSNGYETKLETQIIKTTNVPNKIYYHYDWRSSVHYDYMRYNADSAILTFSVDNPMLSDTITPIDSAYIVFHDSPIAVGYNEFPLQVKDTISILDDVTFHYTIGGLLKGQKCGEATHTIRIHKSEVISEQDETHRHQGETYEYDE